MEALNIAGGILTLLTIFLSLRFFFKRLRLLISLKRATKEIDAKLILTTPMFWLPTNRCKQSEILVIGHNYAYSIKVLGLYLKYCDLHFWNAKEYATHKYLFHWEIAQATRLGKRNVRRKRLSIDFTKALPEDFVGKVYPFYLLSPTNSPIHITKTDAAVIVDITPGDKIDDIIFADREYLYQHIRLSLHEYTSKKRFDI